MSRAEAVLFAGPSALGLSPDRWVGVDRRPPARRGDVEALVQERSGRRARGPGRVLVLADGVFQTAPAVSHAELCLALDSGWQVWGVSSLGAIRAWEMRAEGMRGFGWVYRQFARHPDFTDDEMALVHAPEPLFLPLSEPLVNLRYALERRGRLLGIGTAPQAKLIEMLRACWFGDRTLELMIDLMVGPLRIPPAAVEDLLDWMLKHRIKTLDLDRLLVARPWRRAGAGGPQVELPKSRRRASSSAASVDIRAPASSSSCA